MQRANGTVIISPENQQFRYDVTPAEALLLYQLHRVYANGTPLGDDFVIQDGPALTIDAEAKPAEEGYFDQHRGKHIDGKDAVPAKAHERTNAEEIARLKKKYTGNLTVNGQSMPAFSAVFGNSPGVQLPKTFAEISEAIGVHFHEAEPAEASADRKRAFELGKKPRPELCEIAVGLKLKVSAADSKDFIVAAIINCENKLRAVTAPETPA